LAGLARAGSRGAVVAADVVATLLVIGGFAGRADAEASGFGTLASSRFASNASMDSVGNQGRAGFVSPGRDGGGASLL